MQFREPPPSAAWWHRQARSGFEVVYFHSVDDGHQVTGCTTAVEDGQTWILNYELHLDIRWRTRSARVHSRFATGVHAVEFDTDGEGRWRVDGSSAPLLDGCLDIDLESSVMTNGLPVHRLALTPGQRAAAPAVYVRAPDLAALLAQPQVSRRCP